MSHLTPDEFVDAAEGTLDPARRRHLDTCDQCRHEAVALAAVLTEASRVEVPEPSPLFWHSLSARVRDAVAREGSPRAEGWAWIWRWPAIAPLGALALLLIALVATVARPPAPAGPAPVAPGVAAVPVTEPVVDRDAWELVVDLIGPLDWETAETVGLAPSPGDAELAVLDLSAEEQQELSRLLQRELGRTKS